MAYNNILQPIRHHRIFPPNYQEPLEIIPHHPFNFEENTIAIYKYLMYVDFQMFANIKRISLYFPYDG